MVIAVGSDAWEDALSPCDERGGGEGLDVDKDSLVVSGNVLETSEICTDDKLLSIASAFVSLSLSEAAAAAPAAAPALDEPRPATDFLNTNFRLGVNPARVSSNFRLSDFRTYPPPAESASLINHLFYFQKSARVKYFFEKIIPLLSLSPPKKTNRSLPPPPQKKQKKKQKQKKTNLNITPLIITR
jgi:hypothetical protein